MDGLIPIIILLSIAASVAVAIVAGKRGRSGFGWFLISAVLSPLFALLLLIALPVVERSEDEGESYSSSSGSLLGLSENDYSHIPPSSTSTTTLGL